MTLLCSSQCTLRMSHYECTAYCATTVQVCLLSYIRTCVACSEDVFVLCILCNKIHIKIVLQYKLFTNAHCV